MKTTLVWIALQLQRSPRPPFGQKLYKAYVHFYLQTTQL